MSGQVSPAQSIEHIISILVSHWWIPRIENAIDFLQGRLDKVKVRVHHDNSESSYFGEQYDVRIMVSLCEVL